jgi:hypothetical protein
MGASMNHIRIAYSHTNLLEMTPRELWEGKQLDHIWSGEPPIIVCKVLQEECIS